MVGTLSPSSVDDVYSFTRAFRIPFLTSSMGKEFLAGYESPLTYKREEAPSTSKATEAEAAFDYQGYTEDDLGGYYEIYDDNNRNETYFDSYVLTVRPRFTMALADLMLFYDWFVWVLLNKIRDYDFLKY